MNAWPKYKVNAWLNERTETVKFGVDRKAEPGAPWKHLATGNRPLFFLKRERADAWILKRRAEQKSANT